MPHDYKRCVFMQSLLNILVFKQDFQILKTTSGQPMLHMQCLGAQKSYGCGQSVHGKSQNFLKHNVPYKSFWVIQAHSKS